MTATLKHYLRTLLRGPEPDEGHVHFHTGPQGAPAACHDARCESPRLSL